MFVLGDFEKYKMLQNTFTEFIGNMSCFEDSKDRENYISRKEKEFIKLHSEENENKILEIYENYFKNHYLKQISKKEDEIFSKSQEFAYDKTYLDMILCLGDKIIQITDLKGKILDFGCGTGGSSIFLGLQSEDVTAIDINPKRIEELVKNNLFDNKNALVGDGFEYMAFQKENSYDLITAFGLGMFDTPKGYIEKFYKESTRIIKPKGKIFIESDLLTMDKVRNIFEVNPIPYFPDFVMFQK